MPTLSAEQIREHAAKAGFTGEDLNTAVAVALAESGGNTNAYNGKPPDNSYGLWQINMLGAMGPERRKRFGIVRNEQLFDPDVNARAAYIIFKSQGWARGWTTYSSGKYKDPSIQDLIKKLNPVTIGKTIGETATSPITSVASSINALGSNIIKGTFSVGGIMVAISLLSVGVILLVMSSNSAKKAVNIAANVIPGGQAAKAAVKKVSAK